MKKQLLILIFSPIVLFATRSSALPRFALLRGDASCIGCHVNPTGGQLRGPGGIGFETSDLAMWKRGDNIKYTGEIGNGVRLGGDFRSQMLYFAQTSPLYTTTGDSLHKTLVKRGDTSAHIFGFQSMSLAFELDVQATNTLHGFFRYDPLNTAVPSEGWAMLHFVHSSGEIFKSGDVVTNAYIKIGAFLPAFGIRFDDHTVYVKEGNGSLSKTGTGFPTEGFFWYPGYRDIGGELGALFFDHLGIVAGIFNGSELTPGVSFNPTNSKALCFRANYSGEIIEDALAAEIGASHYMHASDQNANNLDLSLTALHFSLRAGPVTILNEYDFGTNLPLFTPDGSLIGVPKKALCSELAFHAVKGLDLLFRYETYKDENPAGVTNIEVKDRVMFGAQWFPLRFLEIRPELRIAQSTVPNSSNPSIRDDLNETTFLAQTHVFF